MIIIEKGIIAMDFIISSVLSFLTELEVDAFTGFKGKIRKTLIKRKLKFNISKKILKQYGNEVYYNDLDQFLMQNNVVENIIRNCDNESLLEYKPRTQIVDYYVKLFVEQHPEFSKYHYIIKRVIQNYFIVVFESLNNIHSESARIVCNYSRELTDEISRQLSIGINELSSEFSELNKKIDILDTKANRIIETESEICPSFSEKDYYLYLNSLFIEYPNDSYIHRKIYSELDPSKTNASIEILLSEKKVLLLGEAGFGKTFESVTLLRNSLNDKRTENTIPVFFKLQEYGIMYPDIFNGIKKQVDLFCIGNKDKIVNEWLENGKLLFIFDGLDDITSEKIREQFIIEANNYLNKYCKNLFFFTARINRYYGEISIQKKYYLSAIDEYTIRKELQRDNIIVDVPQNYYELFANPFFLSVGKTVLRKSHNRELFNRSQLLNELFKELYDGLERKKGKSIYKVLSYSEALSILGGIAYSSFSQPSYSILEFDQLICDRVSSDKSSAIASFIGSGLFVVSDRIVFSNKLLKEYCVAYYFVQNYSLEKNASLYKDLICRDDRNEMVLFIAGLFNSITLQDQFLDMVMQYNFPLYIKCVNSKNDLCENMLESNSQEMAIRLLSQILKSYTYIVQHYFLPIANLFDPENSDVFLPDSDKKVGIVGCLSENGSWIDYWFDIIPIDDAEVTCVSEHEYCQRLEEFKARAIHERRNISTYGTNIKLSGLMGDSGRKIALNLIKQIIKRLVEKKELIESTFLLCERIACYKRKLKCIKTLSEISAMKDTVDSLISEALHISPDIQDYISDGISLFHLKSLLDYLYEKNIEYNDCILPGPDIAPSENTHRTGDLYSEDQKKKRLESYFYFHEISYLYMVKNNFPNLYTYFSRVKDSPYQVIVLYHQGKSDGINTFDTDSRIEYYHIASESEDIPLPKIIDLDDDLILKKTDQVFSEIQRSYSQKSKIASNITITATTFSYTLSSRGTGTNDPLSDYVYHSIEKSLEELFGQF